MVSNQRGPCSVQCSPLERGAWGRLPCSITQHNKALVIHSALTVTGQQITILIALHRRKLKHSVAFLPSGTGGRLPNLGPVCVPSAWKLYLLLTIEAAQQVHKVFSLI